MCSHSQEVTGSKTFHVNLSRWECSLVNMLFSIANFKFCNITSFCSPVSYIINFRWVLFPWGTSDPLNTSLTLVILCSHPTGDRRLAEAAEAPYGSSSMCTMHKCTWCSGLSSDNLHFTAHSLHILENHQDHKLTPTLPPKQQYKVKKSTPAWKVNSKVSLRLLTCSS